MWLFSLHAAIGEIAALYFAERADFGSGATSGGRRVTSCGGGGVGGGADRVQKREQLLRLADGHVDRSGIDVRRDAEVQSLNGGFCLFRFQPRGVEAGGIDGRSDRHLREGRQRAGRAHASSDAERRGAGVPRPCAPREAGAGHSLKDRFRRTPVSGEDIAEGRAGLYRRCAVSPPGVEHRRLLSNRFLFRFDLRRGCEEFLRLAKPGAESTQSIGKRG